MDIEMQPVAVMPPPQEGGAAPPQPQAPVVEEEVDDFFPAVLGGATGSCILAVSFIFTVFALVIMIEVKEAAHKLILRHDGEDKMVIAYSYRAYGSAAALLVSLAMEHVFLYRIVGAAVLAAQHDPPRIRWRRYLLIVLSLLWGSIVGQVVCFTIGVYHFHHREYSPIALDLVFFFDCLILVSTIGLQVTAVRLRSIILARSWMDVCPLLVAEVGEYEECSICHDTPAVGDILRRLPCAHLFHRHCIDEWFEESRTCPMCRQAVQA